MWKLDANNHLINEADTNKHVYFNYKLPPTGTQPHIQSQSRTIKINENNKEDEHLDFRHEHCDKLTFEYASTDYKYFQIKQRTQRDCIRWDRTKISTEIATCWSINSPVKDYRQSSNAFAIWFTWDLGTT